MGCCGIILLANPVGIIGALAGGVMGVAPSARGCVVTMVVVGGRAAVMVLAVMGVVGCTATVGVVAMVVLLLTAVVVGLGVGLLLVLAVFVLLLILLPPLVNGSSASSGSVGFSGAFPPEDSLVALRGLAKAAPISCHPCFNADPKMALPETVEPVGVSPVVVLGTPIW